MTKQVLQSQKYTTSSVVCPCCDSWAGHVEGIYVSTLFHFNTGNNRLLLLLLVWGDLTDQLLEEKGSGLHFPSTTEKGLLYYDWYAIITSFFNKLLWEIWWKWASSFLWIPWFKLSFSRAIYKHLKLQSGIFFHPSKFMLSIKHWSSLKWGTNSHLDSTYCRNIP